MELTNWLLVKSVDAGDECLTIVGDDKLIHPIPLREEEDRENRD